MAGKNDLKQKKMAGKWQTKPSLAEKMADILRFVADKKKLPEQRQTSFGICLHNGKQSE